MNSTVPIYVNPALIAILLSAFALLVAWLTFQRAGDWRKTDAGKDMAAKLNGHGERLTILETRQENLATKADIAELKGMQGALKAELDGVRSDARDAANGVARIEQLLMNGSDA